MVQEKAIGVLVDGNSSLRSSAGATLLGRLFTKEDGYNIHKTSLGLEIGFLISLMYASSRKVGVSSMSILAGLWWAFDPLRLGISVLAHVLYRAYCQLAMIPDRRFCWHWSIFSTFKTCSNIIHNLIFSYHVNWRFAYHILSYSLKKQKTKHPLRTNPHGRGGDKVFESWLIEHFHSTGWWFYQFIYLTGPLLVEYCAAVDLLFLWGLESLKMGVVNCGWFALAMLRFWFLFKDIIR